MGFKTLLNLEDSKFCQASGCTLTLRGNTIINDLGKLCYQTNRQNLTCLAMTHVGYVTGLTSGLGTRVTTIENNYVSGGTIGLTKLTNTKLLKLGGELSQSTSLYGSGTLIFSGGSKISSSCGYQISGTTILKTPRTTSSIFIGSSTGNITSTGTNNVGIGVCSITGITTGSNNTAIGTYSLLKNSTGSNNVSIGTCAGRSNTGSTNIFIGHCAGHSLTKASNSLYIGTGSTNPLISGSTLSGGTIFLPYLKLRCTPAAGSENDSVLVWNSTDRSIKKIAGNAVLSSAITGATNGLSVSNRCVKLGGNPLTGNTTICLNAKTLTISGSSSRLQLNDLTTNLGCNAICFTKSPYISYLTESSGRTFIGVVSGTTNPKYRAIEIDSRPSGKMFITDSVCSKGLEYATEYKPRFTKYSLPDVDFVTGCTNLIISNYVTGGTNGICKPTGTKRLTLGGALSENTTICGSATNYSLTLGTSASRLSALCVAASNIILSAGTCTCLFKVANYAASYSFGGRSLVDAAFVTACTSSIITNYVTGGTNGICKPIGTKRLELGGVLCRATTISGGSQNLSLGTSASKINTFSVVGSGIGLCSSGALTMSAGTFTRVHNLIKYNACYHNSYDNRTLPDVAFVTGCTNAIIANYVVDGINGLTKTVEKKLKLGGALCENTLICGGRCCLYFGNPNVEGSNFDVFKLYSNTNCICGVADICLLSPKICSNRIDYLEQYSFGGRSLVDAAYVTGLTSQISDNFINDAKNGLTKVGTTVKLGGAITADTTISTTNSKCLSITAPLSGTCVQSFTFVENANNLIGENKLYVKTTNNINSLVFNRHASCIYSRIGEENLICVVNNTGYPLAKGTVVYVCQTGLGGILSVGKAIATEVEKSNTTVGVVVCDITNGDPGYVTNFGLVCFLNTGSLVTIGTPLYLSDASAGSYTSIVPKASSEKVLIGYVHSSHQTDGSIFVNIKNITPYVSCGVFIGYTATTNTNINSRLRTCIFTGYTASTNTRFNNIEAITGIAVTGATNGLSKDSYRRVCLGGDLTKDTTIGGGLPIRSICYCSMGNICNTINNGAYLIEGYNLGKMFLKASDKIEPFSAGNVAEFNPGTTYKLAGLCMSYEGTKYYDYTQGCAGIQYHQSGYKFVTNSLVTKEYVDGIVGGLVPKQAVNLATTASIILTGITQQIDGFSLQTGYRILVKDQVTKSQNGIYSANTGNWGRTSDYNFNPAGEVARGNLVSVISGNTQGNTVWINDSPGTSQLVSGDTITFSRFITLGITNGDGINITNEGANKKISVLLCGTYPGLCLESSGLKLNPNVFGGGILVSGGTDIKKIYLNAVCQSYTQQQSSQYTYLCVKLNTDAGASCQLYIDPADITTKINFITGASNGITYLPSKKQVQLGGCLIQNTIISGATKNLYLGHSGGTDNSIGRFYLGYSNRAFIDDFTLNPYGLQYVGDYSSSFIDNSLVSKKYVRCSYLSGATNGLTRVTGSVNSSIGLGGQLTGYTRIYTSGYDLDVKLNSNCFSVSTTCNCYLQANSCIIINNKGGDNKTVTMLLSGGTISLSTDKLQKCSIYLQTATASGITVTAPTTGIVYNADYSSSFVPNSLITKKFVTDTYVSGATNGLTIDSVTKKVKLGGTLTGNTNICCAYTLNFINGSMLNSNTGYQISGCTILRTGGAISNVFIGDKSGKVGNNNNNVAIGYGAMSGISTGAHNVGVGRNTLKSLTSGCNNIAIGCEAGRAITGAHNNILLGNCAGCSLSTACRNIFIGDCAGAGNSLASVSGMLYIGSGSTNPIISGSNITNIVAVPNLRLRCTPDINNTLTCILVWDDTTKCVKARTASSLINAGIVAAENGIVVDPATNKVKLGGSLTGDTTITGSYTLSLSQGDINTACGYKISGNTVLRTSRNDINNIYLGSGAGDNNTNTTGSRNIAIGYMSLLNNTTGCNNIAQGDRALYCNINGDCNIAIGHHSLYCNTGGTTNIAIGIEALYCNLKGSSNIAIGYQTLYSNRTGTHNLAQGQFALYCNTVGTSNIAQGNGALQKNTTGSCNIAQGQWALYCNTIGSNNVALGFSVLDSNVSGCTNLGIGYFTLCSNKTGCFNIGMGSFAGPNNTTGCNNIYIGMFAGYNNTIGSDLVFIGNCSGKGMTGGTKTIVIGDYNFTASTNGSYGVSSTNKLIIGNEIDGNNCLLICGDFTDKTVALPCLKLTERPQVYTDSSNMDGILYSDISTDSGQGYVKRISRSTLLTNVLTGATNGLSLASGNHLAKLGGSLCDATTTINISGKTLSFYDSIASGTHCLSTANIYLSGKTGVGIKQSSSGSALAEICLTSGNVCLKSKSNIVLSASTNVNISATTTNINGNLYLCNLNSLGTVNTEYVLMLDDNKKVRYVNPSLVGDSNNRYCYTIVSAGTSTTLTSESSYLILVSHPSKSYIVNLPANPVDKQAFKIKDATNNALSYNISISPGDKNIDGQVEANVLINTNSGAVELVYAGSPLNSWYTLGFVN